jgi:hypothetical protein
MLRITEDDAHGCFVLEPTGSLRTADFDALTQRFDTKVAAGGPIPNFVIHSESFPTWANFAAMLEHLRFIRDHHRRIEKVALVSDARILDVAPKVARHFVAARLRHFPANALDEALAWVSVRDDEPAHVVLIEGLPDDTVGISVRGVIGAQDYAETIVPAIEAKLARHDRIKVLYEVGPEFEAYTAGALWSDTRLGVTNLTRFSKVAVVTDIPWMRGALRIFAPLVPAEIHVFATAGLAEAKAWIAA